MALYCLASRVLFLLLGREGNAKPQQEYSQEEHLNYQDVTLQSHFTLPKMLKIILVHIEAKEINQAFCPLLLKQKSLLPAIFGSRGSDLL
jgi:hypothetical protein